MAVNEKRVYHPALCPQCGANPCFETAPPAVHCSSQHRGGQDCDWRMPIDVEEGQGLCLIPVDNDPAGGDPWQ
jgi:hypothetical protein